MPVFIRDQWSSSPAGLPISVTATNAAAGQTLHRVQATATNVLECVTVWGYNHATTVSNELTLEVTNGSSSVFVKRTLTAQIGALSADPTLVLSQLPLSGTDVAVHVLNANIAATDALTRVWGFVDRIATA